jgi:hypothetical protein
MKKADLLETAILLLGLWSLYNGLIALFYVVYYFLGETFSYSPVYDPAFFSAYASEAISYGMLVFLCFAKRNLLLRNLNFPLHDDEQKEGKEGKTDVLESRAELKNIATKVDLMEIGIVVLCLGVFFTALPYFLYALFNLFKSKVSGDDKHVYNVTLPFFKLLIPAVIIVIRDKVIQLLYPAKEIIS